MAMWSIGCKIPNVQAFDLDVLMLVSPESEYSKKVPVTIGTIHIDEIMPEMAARVNFQEGCHEIFTNEGK